MECQWDTTKVIGMNFDVFRQLKSFIAAWFVVNVAVTVVLVVVSSSSSCMKNESKRYTLNINFSKVVYNSLFKKVASRFVLVSLKQESY